MSDELMQRAQMLYAQSAQVQEHLAFIDQQAEELKEFQNNLATLENSSEKELLASLGKGVFVKSEIKSNDLFVDVGAGVILKKNPKEVSEVIGHQLKKLGEMREQSVAQFLELNRELEHLLRDLKRTNARE